MLAALLNIQIVEPSQSIANLGIFGLYLISESYALATPSKPSNLHVLDFTIWQDEGIRHCGQKRLLLFLFDSRGFEEIGDFGALNVEFFICEEDEYFPLFGAVVHFSEIFGVVCDEIEALEVKDNALENVLCPLTSLLSFALYGQKDTA